MGAEVESVPTGTWKVVLPFPGVDLDAEPAVVWRGSEKACWDWIEARAAVEPGLAVMEYDVHGPLAPVPLTCAVVDRMAPPGEGRVVERFSVIEEAERFVVAEAEIRRLPDPFRDHAAIAADDLPAALAAEPLRAPRGGAIREVPAPAHLRPPELRAAEASAVARTLPVSAGTVEARHYYDGHVRVSAGSLGEPLPRLAPLAGPGGTRLAIDCVVWVEGATLANRGLRYELRDDRDQPVEDPALHAEAVGAARSAVREAVNALLETHPHDRLEALERRLASDLARLASERRSIETRLAAIGREEGRARDLYTNVVSVLSGGAVRAAEAAPPSPAEAPIAEIGEEEPEALAPSF